MVSCPPTPLATSVERQAQRRALNDPVLRVCRRLLALAAFTAIGYDVAAGPGVSDADYFSYFTVLSNLFAAAMLLMPVAVTLDWLLDPTRVRLDPARTVVLWMAFPLLYVVYSLARGAIVGWYPYFFVNPHRGGEYLLVAGDCLAVGIGIVALIAATAWAGNRRRDASSGSPTGR